MSKEYRTIQPSKHEGRISREAATSVFRAIAEGRATRERDAGSGKYLHGAAIGKGS